MKPQAQKTALARISFPGAYRFASGTRHKAVVLPPCSEETPTVEELLLMFEEDTQVNIDPLCGVLSDEDILDETFIVQEEELLTLSDATTQVTPAVVELQVYYFVCPPATDVDMIASFSWQMTSYRMNGQEQFVCQVWIDGFLCECWRGADGFIAQPIG